MKLQSSYGSPLDGNYPPDLGASPGRRARSMEERSS
jgi:hypothetical protein